jgi:hyaluronan synthase
MDTPQGSIFQVISPGDPALDQRRYPRTLFGGDVDVIAGRWLGRRRLRGQVRDASPTGITVELDGEPLSAGTPVRVRWQIPAGLCDEPLPKRRVTLHGQVTRANAPQGRAAVYGIRFDRLVAENVIRHREHPYRWFVAVLGLIVAAFMYWPGVASIQWFWYEPVLQMYTLFFGVFILSRVFLSFFYREPTDAAHTPTVTIIIPVMNEEKQIAQTVRHSFDVRYPSDKLEVIVVDDGSTDRTWDQLEKLQKQYPRLRAFQFKENQGKHNAMALGVREASGEILVFVDSDSMVHPEAIYRIVQPFVDSSIGAVAGQIQVAPPDHGKLIARMEAVHYFLSHRINKAAESLFGSVTCCPGALSAYRKAIVVNVIPVWLKQTFMGGKIMLGDDRSLTNCVLRTHRVIYHHGAICSTYVPDTWKKWFRQQVRWKKSWLQETLVASRIMIHKHPIMVLSYYTEVVLTLVSPLVMTYMVGYLPLVSSASALPYLYNLVLLYTLFGLYFRYYNRNSYWYYSFFLVPLYVTVLSWQNYYAMVTIHKNKWSTR